MKWVSRALRFSLLACALFLLCEKTGSFDPYTDWWRLGSVQIVAGPDEAWLFVELEHVVHNPFFLVEVKNIVLEHTQVVVIIGPDGVRRQIPVSRREGVTFHPNISTIFRMGDDFYLYEDFSMNTHRSVFTWTNDHFELLPFSESEEFVRDHQLDVNGHFRIEANEPGEWARIYEDARNSKFDKKGSFVWSKRTFEFEVIDVGDDSILKLRRVENTAWEAEIARFRSQPKSVSAAERERLRNSPGQQGHPRGAASLERAKKAQ